MNILKRLFGQADEQQPTRRQPEKMTVPKVDFSFRVYWTKMTRTWSAARRDAARQQALAITTRPDFDQNLIDKRYELVLEGIPEEKHSGASLMALLEVLAALDAVEESEP